MIDAPPGGVEVELMRVSTRRNGQHAAITGAALLLSMPLWAAGAQGKPDAENAVSGVWTSQELRFLYQGFTSHYSCDGLEAKVRKVLLQLGSRKDLTVRPFGCSSPFGVPDPFPAVTIKMNVLRPAGAAGTAADAPAVPAHWQPVEVRLDRDPVWQAGDCELLEQIKQRILPLFTTRNVRYRTNCVPFQLSPGGTQLSAEVLVPDQNDAKPVAAR
jgi:hypothetical protein